MPSADELAAAIEAGLLVGRAPELIDTCKDLMAIDPNKVRSRGLNGIVLLYAGFPDQARAVLEGIVAEFGEVGWVLTNLARTHQVTGRGELAYSTLRRALQIDPNQNAALIWYLQTLRESRGIQARHDALIELAQLPGSWRAQLWLARDRLDADDLAGALELYKQSLAMGYDSDSLIMISGDLGERDFQRAALAICESIYVPGEHSDIVGSNLMSCHLDLGQKEAGEALLRRITDARGEAVAEMRGAFADAFAKL